MLVPEFYRDCFDLVPRPPRFAPTAAGAFRFAFDDDYANKHAEHKTAISCPDGRWFNNNLAQHSAALSEKSFGCRQSGPYEKRASVRIDPMNVAPQLVCAQQQAVYEPRWSVEEYNDICFAGSRAAEFGK
jgi:hypothetical protein